MVGFQPGGRLKYIRRIVVYTFHILFSKGEDVAEGFEMKRFLKGLFLLSGVVFLSFAGSAPPSQAGAENPMKVFVSILPQKYFVKKIAGDLTDVFVP